MRRSQLEGAGVSSLLLLLLVWLVNLPQFLGSTYFTSFTFGSPMRGLTSHLLPTSFVCAYVYSYTVGL